MLDPIDTGAKKSIMFIYQIKLNDAEGSSFHIGEHGAV